ncbi:hypothetical protein BY458DRAFT_511997 [Sporodiniella umbellata]|nr:hypothetical protein BY458DRAFT_511997 [Sporodiniella umbellata]
MPSQFTHYIFFFFLLSSFLIQAVSGFCPGFLSVIYLRMRLPIFVTVLHIPSLKQIKTVKRNYNVKVKHMLSLPKPPNEDVLPLTLRSSSNER